jgi:hypothetical protein
VYVVQGVRTCVYCTRSKDMCVLYEESGHVCAVLCLSVLQNVSVCGVCACV